MPRFSDTVLDDLFMYHAPTPEQIPKYQAIRDGAKLFAKVLRDNVPDGADQAAAIRHVREAMMTGNAGIATKTKTISPTLFDALPRDCAVDGHEEYPAEIDHGPF